MNPHAGGGRYTSKRNAERMIARGFAVFAGPNAIRLLEEEELRVARRLRADLLRNERYWREIARERGGEDVTFLWRGGKVPAYPGADPRLGYSVMGAQVIATPRSPQPAKEVHCEPPVFQRWK